jgi:hypothetical protein
MDAKKDEKSIIEYLLQDMNIKLRDIDDFEDHLRYKEILSKFQKGYEEEYSQS